MRKKPYRGRHGGIDQPGTMKDSDNDPGMEPDMDADDMGGPHPFSDEYESPPTSPMRAAQGPSSHGKRHPRKGTPR